MTRKNGPEQSKRPQLQQFTIKNFKAFQECTLSLPSLTILIGENSSGKSSILQTLLLLKQTLEGPSGTGVLNLNSHYVQFHQFKEIVFGMPSGAISLAFNLQFKDFQISFEVGYRNESDDWPDLLSFKVNGQDLSVTEASVGPKNIHLLVEKPLMILEGFIPGSFFYDYNEYYKILRSFFENIGYMQPIRPAPKRYYTLSGIKPRWIGVQAEDIADFLAANPLIAGEVRDWFVRSAKLANQVKFKSDRKRGQMEILFTESTTGLEIDISRLGFGFSQILPIVVATYSDMNMLIFDAPEIHLNPSLHGELTDLFIAAANNNKQVLVETHSEHIIYRIQRRVAEGQIRPEDVAIYYVRRGQNGSVIERLSLTRAGEIPHWPDGFFEAEVEDIYQRVLAVRND